MHRLLDAMGPGTPWIHRVLDARAPGASAVSQLEATQHAPEARQGKAALAPPTRDAGANVVPQGGRL